LASSVDHAFPRLHQDYFLHSSHEIVKRAVKILLEKGYGRQSHSTVAAAAADATATGSQGQNSACNELESHPSDEGTKSGTAVDDETQPDSTSEEDKPPLRSGLKIVDIDVEAEFLQSLQEHSTKCGHVMHPDEPRKIGFDALTQWHCPVCDTKISTITVKHGSSVCGVLLQSFPTTVVTTVNATR
jgi:hypothetical protein